MFLKICSSFKCTLIYVEPLFSQPLFESEYRNAVLKGIILTSLFSQAGKQFFCICSTKCLNVLSKMNWCVAQYRRQLFVGIANILFWVAWRINKVDYILTLKNFLYGVLLIITLKNFLYGMLIITQNNSSKNAVWET